MLRRLPLSPARAWASACNSNSATARLHDLDPGLDRVARHEAGGRGDARPQRQPDAAAGGGTGAIQRLDFLQAALDQRLAVAGKGDAQAHVGGRLAGTVDIVESAAAIVTQHAEHAD